MCTVLNVSPSGLEEAVRQRVNGNKVVLQTVQELVVVQLGPMIINSCHCYTECDIHCVRNHCDVVHALAASAGLWLCSGTPLLL